MIFQKSLISGLNKVETAIERIKLLTAGKKVTVAFSGGKDSMTVKTLCDMAGIEYDLRYRVTSMDAPETIRFIKSQGAKFEYPGVTIWELIRKFKGFLPVRMARYCCGPLKEVPPANGEMILIGVRWAESAKRSKRLMTEHCMKTNGKKLHPIIDWSDADVWEFHKAFDVPYCSLYDQGYKRIGCIGCPMKSERERERDFQRYPWFREKLIRLEKELIAKHGCPENALKFRADWLHCNVTDIIEEKE